jgi:hypothetical protein
MEYDYDEIMEEYELYSNLIIMAAENNHLHIIEILIKIVDVYGLNSERILCAVFWYGLLNYSEKISRIVSEFVNLDSYDLFQENYYTFDNMVDNHMHDYGLRNMGSIYFYLDEACKRGCYINYIAIDRLLQNTYINSEFFHYLCKVYRKYNLKIKNEEKDIVNFKDYINNMIESALNFQDL